MLLVIVTPAVYPRLLELHHVDIQSTEQKSHCLLPTSDSGGLGLFFKKNASPGGLFGPQVSVLPRDGRRWSIYTQEVVVGELKIVISEQQLWNHWCCFSGRWRSPALPCAAVRWNGWGSSGGDPKWPSSTHLLARTARHWAGARGSEPASGRRAVLPAVLASLLSGVPVANPPCSFIFVNGRAAAARGLRWK